MAIETGTDYVLHLSLKGTTAGVSVKESGKPNWQGMLGHVFHAVTVDGGFGLLSKDGASSFDQVTVKTNDPGFATSGDGEDASLAAVDPLDVNGDGIVSAADVLLVLNTVNGRGGNFTLVGSAVAPHLDVNRDGLVSPLDVLIIVNYLNTATVNSYAMPYQGEGEAASTFSGREESSTEEHSGASRIVEAYDVDDNLARSVSDAWRLQTAQRQDDRGELLAQMSLNPELADGALDGLLQDLTARTSRN